MNHTPVIEKVFSWFTYRADPSRDHWRIDKTSGPFEGDCEDFALTLLWQLSGRSTVRFWWNLLILRAVFWHVTTTGGEGHLVLRWRGAWADNTMPGWYQTAEMTHRRRYPLLILAVAGKFLLARIRGAA